MKENIATTFFPSYVRTQTCKGSVDTVDGPDVLCGCRQDVALWPDQATLPAQTYGLSARYPCSACLQKYVHL